MNIKRLILTIVAAFFFYFGSDFLVHEVWMKPGYQATAALWRTETEMTARLPWMAGGHLLFVIAFAVVWAKGFAQRGCLRDACVYGVLMGLFFQANTLITYTVSPLPPAIPIKWFFTGLAQSVLLGVIVFFTYKPPCETKEGCSNSSEKPRRPI